MHGLTGLLHGNMISRVEWSGESLVVVCPSEDGGGGEAIAAGEFCRLFDLLLWLVV